MTHITTSTDCGNSPKNQLLQDLVIALARADVAALQRFVTADVSWQSPGTKPVTGIDAFSKAVARHGAASKLTVHHVISHGKAGAIDGLLETGGELRAFCHVFEFSSAKGTQVSSITTYSVVQR